MNVTAIWTVRRLRHQVFRQIVEEWEDDFAAILRLPLRDMSERETRANGRFGALLRRLPGAFTPWDDGGRVRRSQVEALSLAFVLWPPAHERSFWVQADVVPIVIDFWNSHLPQAERIFARSPLLFVTNHEIQRDLAATALSRRTQVLPLSVSARHVQRQVPHKTIDLIQVGRRNPRLHQWALDYVRHRPQASYLYADTSGTWPRWTTTDRGPLDIDTSRDAYWRLLLASRVSLVSSPGIDGGEARTGGYNPVTPRFYESAAARCHLVGRFPRTGADFVANRVESVCPHVETFDDFVSVVDRARQESPDMAALDAFLAGHTTADVVRAVQAALGAAHFTLAA